MEYSFWDALPVGVFFLFILSIIIKTIAKPADIDAFSPEKIKVGWFVIGMSLVATDVSLAYIIGSAGMGYQKGLAVGSYGWTASFVIIIVALYVLPKLMRVGIKTLPEYLELRFSPFVRLIVAVVFLFFIIGVGLSSVFYSFSFLIVQVFSLDAFWLTPIVWIVGVTSGLVLFSSGIEQAMKLDVIIAIAMLVAGLFVVALCIFAVGGFDLLIKQVPSSHLSSVLSADDDFLPWTQVFLGGLWLLHLNYWAFNPPIVQKALVASSLSEAQKGFLLAASVKIIVPFIFVLPGVAGLVLFGSEISNQDTVFPRILKELVPIGFKGFVMIAFSATVISSANAMLNSAASIFTLDIFQRFIRPYSTDQFRQKVYRYAIIGFVLFAVLAAPYVRNYKHIFDLSQQIRSVISPGLLITFLLALFIAKAPVSSAWVAILGTYPVYYVMSHLFKELPAVDLFGVNVLALILAVVLWVLFKPLEKPVYLKGKKEIRFERNLVVVTWSVFIITFVMAVYLIFM